MLCYSNITTCVKNNRLTLIIIDYSISLVIMLHIFFGPLNFFFFWFFLFFLYCSKGEKCIHGYVSFMLEIFCVVLHWILGCFVCSLYLEQESLNLGEDFIAREHFFAVIFKFVPMWKTHSNKTLYTQNRLPSPEIQDPCVMYGSS